MLDSTVTYLCHQIPESGGEVPELLTTIDDAIQAMLLQGLCCHSKGRFHLCQCPFKICLLNLHMQSGQVAAAVDVHS